MTWALSRHPYSQSYARVHLGAGGYFLPVSQEGGSGSSLLLLLRPDGIPPWWIHQSHRTHTLQTCASRVIPLQMFSASTVCGADYSGWGDPKKFWTDDAPAPPPILLLRAPDSPADDSTASANKIWTSWLWNVNYLMNTFLFGTRRVLGIITP